MMRDFGMPLDANSLEVSIYSRDMKESFSIPKQNTTAGKRFLHVNDNSSNLRDFFGDEEIFYNSEDQDEYKCNANSTFIGDKFLDEECGLSWKNWPCDLDYNTADYLRFGNHEKPDFLFEGLQQKKRASTEAARRFNFSESSAPYVEHQILEKDHDFMTPDSTWYPAARRNCDFRDITSQSAWPCFVRDDESESLSLLSEESCSSGAVWRETTKNPPHNTLRERNTIREHDADSRSPLNNLCVKKNIYAQQHCKNRDKCQQPDSINGPGICMRMPKSSSSRLAHNSTTTTFHEKSSLEHSRLFGEGYPTGTWNVKPGFSSCNRTSGIEKNAPSGCKLWTEEPLGAYSVRKLHFDAKLSPDISQSCDVSAECSPSRSFLSEKAAFCKQLSPVHSDKTPIFPDIASGSKEPDLSPDFNIERRPQESLSGSGCQGKINFPNIPIQGSVSEDGEVKSSTILANTGQFELRQDMCNQSNCEEPKGRTPQLAEGLNAPFSPERSDAASSSVEIPCKLVDACDRRMSKWCPNFSPMPTWV